MLGTLSLILASAGPWTTIADQGGVIVETKALSKRQTLVRGRTELDVPADRVIAVLKRLEDFGAWIPSLITWKVIERDERQAIVYARHDLPWPMDDRDYTVRYTWLTRGQTFRLRAKSIAKGPSPEAGVIRLKRVQSEWVVEPVGSGRARVSYTYNGELGGDLPKSLAKQAWRDEPPRLFAALKTALSRKE